jgi:hypothetical protein
VEWSLDKAGKKNGYAAIGFLHKSLHHSIKENHASILDVRRPGEYDNGM